VEVEDLKFLRAHTDRRVKITLPGPFTMSQQALDEHYGDPRRLALAYADAVNGEVRDLFAAGADIVQLDEPYMQAAPERARAFGVEALDRALDGVTGATCVHLCFGYAALVKERPSGYSFLPELAHARCAQVSIETAQSGLDCSVLRQLPGKTILVGVIDLADGAVEAPAERIVVAPDCGMKYLPRDVAAGKLRALVAGAALVRKELGAG
jgi:5-methyltetrahydropteroyltriglutamate--homocysteine methyltransferase